MRGLSSEDGVGVFNRMYLTVTERMAAMIAGPGAGSPTFHDATDDGRPRRPLRQPLVDGGRRRCGGTAVSPAWRPLFEARAGGRLPVQYAIAGMNSHIEHDLPVAVVDLCLADGLEPGDVHADYDAVNAVLSEVESGVRRSFLDTVGREVDDRLGPVSI